MNLCWMWKEDRLTFKKFTNCSCPHVGKWCNDAKELEEVALLVSPLDAMLTKTSTIQAKNILISFRIIVSNHMVLARLPILKAEIVVCEVFENKKIS